MEKQNSGGDQHNWLTRDKKIIRDWAEMAPLGSNIVGVIAASLKYFGRTLDKLFWPEYDLLAVIPNNPGYVNLRNHNHMILTKRNFLLENLCRLGYFPENDLAIYLDNDLPKHNSPPPQHGYQWL